MLDAGAVFLIPIPTPVGGVVIVGEDSVTYINHWRTNTPSSAGSTDSMKNIQVAAIPTTQISSWGAIDQVISSGSLRYLLGDCKGNIFILVLRIDNDKVGALAINHLGRTNIPENINYLDNGVVYIGCTYGDSQLIRLNKGGSTPSNISGPTNNGCIDVLDSYTNIGPIVDLCVVTGDNVYSLLQIMLLH